MNEEWPHIINRKHFDRLVRLLGSGAISHGGQIDPQTLRISPTILTDVDWDSPVMQEEIFGPILPVLTYRSLDEAIARIQARPKPLALYLFTRDAATEKRVLGEVSFGGGCINDTVLHLATSICPSEAWGRAAWAATTASTASYLFPSEERAQAPARRTWRCAMRPYGQKLRQLKRLM